MKRQLIRHLGILCVLLAAGAAAHADPVYRFDIRGATLEAALKQFATQSGLQVAYFTKVAEGHSAPQVSGTFTAGQALEALLVSSGLTYELIDDRTVAIRNATGDAQNARGKTSGAAVESASKMPLRLASADQNLPTGQAAQKETGGGARNDVGAGIPEIVVAGSKVLNMDIKRSRDDVQPYVIFDAAVIERSGATNLNDFFKQRLSMNTVAINNSQVDNVLGNMSSINLRGMGTNQTLVLIDGKRQPSLSYGGTVNQPDLNGIPLAAIERIEILPATASGIYGGSAVGGVINVVLKRDYDATDLRLKYGNSFKSDNAVKQADIAVGQSWRSGKTNVLFSGTWSENDGLRQGEREFLARGRAAILANNPSYYLSSLPVGSTPNIRSANGSPLFGAGTASYTFVPQGYALGGGLAPLQANAGRLNLELPDSNQINSGAGSLLDSAASLRSATITVRNEFTPVLSGFLDLGYSDNQVRQPGAYFQLNSVSMAASAPGNPFGQAIVLSAPTNAYDGLREQSIEQRRMGAGVIARLPRHWTGEFDYSLNRSYSDLNGFSQAPTLSAALSAGAINLIRDTMTFAPDLQAYKRYSVRDYRSSSENYTLRFAGPIANLPGGKPTVTTIAERRTNAIGDAGAERTDGGPNTPLAVTSRWFPGHQDVESFYMELAVPVFSASNRRPGIEELQVQLAGRYDRYSMRSGPTRVAPGAADPVLPQIKLDSTAPTVGLSWRPLQDVMLRSSYGTGFLPPEINQLNPPIVTASGTNGPLIDPRRGNSVNNTWAANYVGNPNLKPEKSKSFSAGFVLTPRTLQELRLSLDYTRIKKTDAILSYPALSQDLLLANEASFPERVQRGPADGLYPVGPVTFLDLTNLNASRVNVEAYDLQADYTLRTDRFGDFSFFGLVTKQTEYLVQLLPSLPFTNTVGVTSAAPLKWKGNAGVNWQRTQWSAGWVMRYFDAYFVADPTLQVSAVTFANQGGQRVPSQAYHDLYLAYRLPSDMGFVSNAEARLGINNVFNKAPPLDVAVGSGFYGFYSPFGDTNLASYSLSLRMSF